MKSTYATELFVKLFGEMPPKRNARKEAHEAPSTESMIPGRVPKGEVIFHVVPRDVDGRWNVKKQGGERPSAVCHHKRDAVKRAVALAKGHPKSQVIIHNKDGKVARKQTYTSGKTSSQ